jgi:hypothetical protein
LYDRNQTEVSRGALAELALAMELYKDDFVLAGGWTPYFLTQGYWEHCGSIDIDLVLRPSIMVRYESIRDIVMNLGYSPTKSPFRFGRELKTPDGFPFLMHVDFLTEPEAKSQVRWLPKIQEDLQAAFIPGCSIVFTYNYKETVKGSLSLGGQGSVNVRASDIVGTLTMKGLALGRPRKLEKDSYDIYAVAGFHGGDPYKAASRFKQLVEELSDGVKPEVTAEALNKISNGFASSNSYASLAVSRFMETDVSTDAAERVSAFLSKV